MIDNKEVGKKIAAMRQEKGLTQQQLASVMNVSHQAVSKWEGGQALPDIQTMLELTRFFGITIDQLIVGNNAEMQEEQEENVYERAETDNTNDTDENNAEQASQRKERGKMNIQQLLQMAPYMSKETVEEIAMEIEDKLSAGQIARIAPYIRSESVEQLMQKHQPELSWDSLRRIAPYLRREYVDDLARKIASGKENIKPSADNFNKAINDIGKAFDDVGREMKHVVKKGLRFGKRVIKEVSSSISEINFDDERSEPDKPSRSQRVLELRRKAFERAANDGKWDWLAAHMQELEDEPEIRNLVAAKAKEAGMDEWICTNMGGFADAAQVDAAIETANWTWLADKAGQLDKETQERIIRATVEQENWMWIRDCSDQMLLTDCGLEIAAAALKAGERELAAQLAENHLTPDKISLLAEQAYDGEDYEALAMLLCMSEDAAIEKILLGLAGNGKWEEVRKHMHSAAAETSEKLMEMAVEQGDFDAVDMLDQYL